ncbi:GntR family transcriptional regulator [Streptomyces niveus]|uniref:GntR family transcriptional regulator n=1 Tax=Streptomyces niveus TaxID=193462 RepID=UPI003696B4A2
MTRRDGPRTRSGTWPRHAPQIGNHRHGYTKSGHAVIKEEAEIVGEVYCRSLGCRRDPQRHQRGRVHARAPPRSPSETQLIDRYRVSRPTVRKAIAALRAEGLIEVIHGKGSYVRAVPAPAVTIERTITRSGKTFRTGHHQWQQTEAPTVYRTTITSSTGPLLELVEGEALFAFDRLLTDPDTETRALHRTLIPFATADQMKQLAEAPDTESEQIYALLTKAGHMLTWHEPLSASMPLPDERTALHTPDTTRSSTPPAPPTATTDSRRLAPLAAHSPASPPGPTAPVSAPLRSEPRLRRSRDESERHRWAETRYGWGGWLHGFRQPLWGEPLRSWPQRRALTGGSTDCPTRRKLKGP